MNKSNKGAHTNTVQILIDIGICLVVSFVVLLATVPLERAIWWRKVYFFVFFLLITLYVLANWSMQMYNKTTFCYPDRIFRYNTCAFLLAFFVLLCLRGVIHPVVLNHHFFVPFVVANYIALVAGSQVFHLICRRYEGKYTTRTLFVGCEQDYKKYLEYLRKTNTPIKVVGYLPDVSAKQAQLAEHLNELERYIRQHAVDKVCFKEKDKEQYADEINLCVEMGITVEIVINYDWIEKSDCYVTAVGTYPVVVYHTISLNQSEQVVKRVMDIAGALVGSILLSPLMLAAAIAIKLDSPGPVLFAQTRVGMNGRKFKMYKFRTMYVDAEERKKELLQQNEVKDGRMFKIKNDPRITRVGRFLRNTSIDELPQLFNVLLNDMSLVGTRPPTLDEVEKYNYNHWRRISIKPGITGMWQISGRSEITDFEDVVRLDVSYIDGWNIFRDIKIIFQTAFCVLAQKGAY